MITFLEPLNRLKQLQNLTPARIGLSRAGSSISTQDILNFDLDHARARDAVHLPFNSHDISEQLREREIKTIQVQSAAADRSVYLQDLILGANWMKPPGIFYKNINR